jgi:hydrogenase expression/formation protein HypC
MCLAVPAEIIELKEGCVAVIDAGGVRQEISVMLVDDAAPGDFVLVHAGFAIEKIDAAEAAETMRILEEWAASDEIP